MRGGGAGIKCGCESQEELVKRWRHTA